MRLELDPHFRPCEAVDGDEIYPNGILEFNIRRLLAHLGATAGFPVELIALEDKPHAYHSAGLNQLGILAEIAPGQYTLIDGHHRVAKARRESVPSIPRYRIRCPEHVAFLTSRRAYETYVEYWNSKVDDTKN